jgi:threonyl-tRNA synthetase
VDGQSAKLGAKIRRAETDKIPHMMIIGKREAEENKVSLRSRSNPELDGPHSIDSAVSAIREEISSKSLPKSRVIGS